MQSIQLNPRFLKGAAVCAAVKDIRYYLNGVLVDIRERETRIISTDGHRLMVLRRELDKDDQDQTPAQIIIPGDVVKAIRPQKSNMDCILSYDPAQWAEGFEGKRECKLSILAGPDLSFEPIDAKFPDFDRVIPRTVPSMEYGHYNGEYVAAFTKAVRIAFDAEKLYTQVWPNGAEASASVTCGRDEFFGVLMPMRGGTVFDAPSWVGVLRAVPEERIAA